MFDNNKSHTECNIKQCRQIVVRNLTKPVGYSVPAYWRQKLNRTC